MPVGDRKLTSFVPVKSREPYYNRYKKYKKYEDEEGNGVIDGASLCRYLEHIAPVYAPSTLSKIKSMIATVLFVEDNIDLRDDKLCTQWLRARRRGYIPNSAPALTAEQLNKFMICAPNNELGIFVVKVCMWIALGSAARACEQKDLDWRQFSQVEIDGIRIYKVTQMFRSKTSVQSSFYLPKDATAYIDHYAAMQATARINSIPMQKKPFHFFWQARPGKDGTLKVHGQVVGKKTFNTYPRTMAKWLDLKDPDKFRGHSGRHTAATILANGGATDRELKIFGGWHSSKSVGRYVDESDFMKKKLVGIMDNRLAAAKERRKQPKVAGIQTPAKKRMNRYTGKVTTQTPGGFMLADGTVKHYDSATLKALKDNGAYVNHYEGGKWVKQTDLEIPATDVWMQKAPPNPELLQPPAIKGLPMYVEPPPFDKLLPAPPLQIPPPMDASTYVPPSVDYSFYNKPTAAKSTFNPPPVVEILAKSAASERRGPVYYGCTFN